MMTTKEKIAVIGAGVMGCDIALELVSFGYQVVLKDLDEETLNSAETKIRKNFKLFKLMNSRFAEHHTEDLLNRINFVTDYNQFDDIHFVIENIPENYRQKKFLYKELGKLCADTTIYGVNTSCISITKIASLMPKPENVIGVHFMNPVPMNPLVEVIRGYYTSEETIEETTQLLGGIKKKCVVVEDYPGFVANRVMMLMINECIWVVQDRVSNPADVDKIFKLGFAHKMGPLATADLIGLDTILNSLNVLYESYDDPKYRPCPLLQKMVDAGQFGKKSGQGFFRYSTK
jgi:3-hydroxybutyryl-CoA dehydrogenase